MPIAKRPNVSTSDAKDRQAEAFISGAGKPERSAQENRKPMTLRFPPELIERIDRAAKRLGINRTAFIVQSAAEKLERMG
jgi:hypothetical protein